jgi:hypothetical protein
VNILNILYLLLTTKFILIFSCFLFSSHIIIITFEQCAKLTVAITIMHRNVTDTACRKCKFRCSLQLNCIKPIMKWLLETLIFIKISPQSVYGKYFIITIFFLQNYLRRSGKRQHRNFGVSLAYSLGFLFLKYLFSINQWELASSGFPFENRLWRAKYYKNMCQSTAIDHAVQCKHRPEFSIEILQNYVADI